MRISSKFVRLSPSALVGLLSNDQAYTIHPVTDLPGRRHRRSTLTLTSVVSVPSTRLRTLLLYFSGVTCNYGSYFVAVVILSRYTGSCINDM